MKAVFFSLCLLYDCILFSLHGSVTSAFKLTGCEVQNVVLLIFLLCMFGGDHADCVWFQ